MPSVSLGDVPLTPSALMADERSLERLLSARSTADMSPAVIAAESQTTNTCCFLAGENREVGRPEFLHNLPFLTVAQASESSACLPPLIEGSDANLLQSTSKGPPVSNN